MMEEEHTQKDCDAETAKARSRFQSLNNDFHPLDTDLETRDGKCQPLSGHFHPSLAEVQAADDHSHSPVSDSQLQNVDLQQPVTGLNLPDGSFQSSDTYTEHTDDNFNLPVEDLQPPGGDSHLPGSGYQPPGDDVEPCGRDSEPSDSEFQRTNDSFNPPDGGWGWVVCFTALSCSGTIFGTMQSFGILFVVMLEQYGQGEGGIAHETSWVASLCTGMTFVTCIVASILSDRFGIRTIAVVGGGLAFLGMLSSAFVDQLMLYYLTYGVLLGFGFALTFIPSMVIVGHYFKKRLALVNGIIALGTASFTALYSLALPPLLEKVGLRYCLLCMSGMLFLLIPYALTWRPLVGRVKRDLDHANGTKCQWLRGLFNITIWRNRAYVIWAVGSGVAIFGSFVPYVHIVQHEKDVFPDSKGHLLPLAMSITSGVSSVITGIVMDAVPKMDRVRLQQFAYLLHGTTISCIPLADSFPSLLCVCMVLSVGNGMFLSVQNPIAFELVGVDGASQALGFLYAFCSAPVTLGPPLAGLMYDYLGSYRWAFHVAGIPAVVGAVFMCLIPRPPLTCSKNKPSTNVQLKDLPTTPPDTDTVEQEPVTLRVTHTQTHAQDVDSLPPPDSYKAQPDIVTSEPYTGSQRES